MRSIHSLNEDEKENENPILKLCCFQLLVATSLFAFVPSKKNSPRVGDDYTSLFFLMSHVFAAFWLCRFLLNIAFCNWENIHSEFFFASLLAAKSTNVCAWCELIFYSFFGIKYRLERKQGSCFTSVAFEYIDLCMFSKCMVMTMIMCEIILYTLIKHFFSQSVFCSLL